MNIYNIIRSLLINKKFNITFTNVEQSKDDMEYTSTYTKDLLSTLMYELDTEEDESSLVDGDVNCDFTRSNTGFLYNLETKIYALPKTLYLLYLYFHFSYNIFERDDFSEKLIRENMPKHKLITEEEISRFIIIYNSLKTDKYYLKVSPFLLPWNDFVIPNIRRCEMVFSKLPKNLTTKVDDGRFDKFEILKIVKDIMNLNSMMEIFDDEKSFNHFMNTQTSAVSINGTACAAKTTLLNSALETIIENIDPNAQVLKSGKTGNFIGKDDNQILAMQYQLISYYSVIKYYTSISDRCPFNNLIWRIILGCVTAQTFTAEHITDLFVENCSRNLIKVMSSFPIIILLDSDPTTNRARMNKRSTGTDNVRAFMEYYVHAQNTIYALFAYLCKWPVFDKSFVPNDPIETNLKQDFIKNLIIDKVNKNIQDSNGKLPNKLNLDYCTFKNKKEYPSLYNGCKKLRIMK